MKTTETTLQVRTTTDYFLFTNLDGNRSINPLHLKRLRNSIAANYIFTVIIVNEKMQVIDGQHRLAACRELNLPVHYIMIQGYGLREVQILNAHSKNWNMDDYLIGYCDLGLNDYLIYRDFKSFYGLGHNECLALLGGTGNKKIIIDFYFGNFKVKDHKKAILVAEKVSAIKPYYDGCKRRSFVYAIMGLLNNPLFIFDEFISKLKLQPTALVDCTTVDNYRELIEYIYNYRRQNKINLRY